MRLMQATQSAGGRIEKKERVCVEIDCEIDALPAMTKI